MPTPAASVGSNINPGSIVRLKSGGRNMTVTAVEAGIAVCVFQNRNEDIEERKFPVVVLVEAPAEEKK